MKKEQILPQALKLLTAGLIGWVVGLVVGALSAVDTEKYGDITELRATASGICRVYSVDEYQVYLCNKGVIKVLRQENSDDRH